MDEREQIISYLKTLAVCHYVYAGLAACGMCFGAFYVGFGSLMGAAIRHAPQTDPSKTPSPEVANLFTTIFAGVGVFIMVLAATVSLLCFLSARAMTRRSNRTLSLVVAGVCCLTGILGIALGVFTFIVLMKPETERLYAETA